MNDDLLEFEHLWNSRQGQYALVHVDQRLSPPNGCIVVDLIRRTALIIEDDNVALKVAARLLECGTPVYPSLPWK